MVFATRWRGRRLLYYRHAPPPSPLDVPREDRDPAPKPPYKGAPSYKSSVYYYWWAFLREHEGYRQFCATQKGDYERLFRDFGDVRNDDFMRWWNDKGRYQFCEPLERHVRVHKPDDLGRITDIRDPAEKIILALPVHGDLHRILAEVEQLIIREQPNISATASWSDAKYQVAVKPVLSSLEKHLKIWEQRRLHPEKKLYELADLAGLTFGPKLKHKEGRAMVVSRYLRQAKCIIEHVGKGQFPIFPPRPRKAKAAA